MYELQRVPATRRSFKQDFFFLKRNIVLKVFFNNYFEISSTEINWSEPSIDASLIFCKFWSSKGTSIYVNPCFFMVDNAYFINLGIKASFHFSSGNFIKWNQFCLRMLVFFVDKSHGLPFEPLVFVLCFIIIFRLVFDLSFIVASKILNANCSFCQGIPKVKGVSMNDFKF